MTKLNSLQILRAFAAIIVLITHVFQKLGYKPFGGYYISGQFGVDIFFILSGFLIYLTLKNDVKVSVYGKKRLFRIYPLYLFALLLYIIFKVNIEDIYITFKDLIQNVLMFPWSGPIGYKSLIIGVAWSTVFEMFFYFLFFILLLFKLNKKRIIYIIPILFIVGKLLIKTVPLLETTPFVALFVSLISSKNMFMFWIGCVISELLLNNKFPLIRKRIYIYVLVLCGLIYTLVQLLPYNFYLSFLICSFLFIVVSQYERYFELDPNNFIINKLIYLGDISYSIYIFHILVINICMYYFGVSNVWLLLTITIIVTLIISNFTYIYIEKPFIKLGKKQ